MEAGKLLKLDPKRERAFIITFIVAFLISAVIFTLMSLHDDKYQHGAPQPENGMLVLGDNSLEENPLMFLIDGWALYRDALLDPVSIEGVEPDQYISIGQYKDMSFGDSSKSPHGSATYRLRMDVSGHVGDNVYTLQLPEIYSAYRLYINGELMLSAGNPDPSAYEAKILTSEITFRATKGIDIIIAVTDRSHYYSGIISPPAFGDTLAVNTMIQGRLVFCALLIGSALMLGIMILFLGMRLSKRSGMLFMCLTLSFVGYMSYIIFHALFPAGMFFHYFETFCYYAMFFFAIWLIGMICNIHTKVSMLVKILDASICVFSILVPLNFSGYHTPMYIFHMITYYYKYFLLLYLMVSVFYAMRRQEPYAPVVLCGLSPFIAATVIRIIFPEHDPIIFGAAIEIACYLMFCFMGWAMAYRAVSRHRHAQVWHHGHYDEHRMPPMPDTEVIEEADEPELQAPI